MKDSAEATFGCAVAIFVILLNVIMWGASLWLIWMLIQWIGAQL